MEKHGAELLLQRMLGNTTATFREGQWEAIDAVVNQYSSLEFFSAFANNSAALSGLNFARDA